MFLPRVACVMLLAIGIASTASADEWTTTYGRMTLPDAPRYGDVHAPYSSDQGRIIGKMLIPKCMGCGPEIDGVWVEHGSAKTCDTPRDGSLHWGDVELKFNGDYTAFDGSWNYCGAGSPYKWTGTLGAKRLLFTDH